MGGHHERLRESWLPSHLIKRGWLETPRTEWRCEVNGGFYLGKTIGISIGKWWLFMGLYGDYMGYAQPGVIKHGVLEAMDRRKFGDVPRNLSSFSSRSFQPAM